MKKLIFLFLLLIPTITFSQDNIFEDSSFITEMNGNNWKGMAYSERIWLTTGFCLGQMASTMYLVGHEYITQEQGEEVVGPKTMKIDILLEIVDEFYKEEVNQGVPIVSLLAQWSQFVASYTRTELDQMLGEYK